MLHHHRDLPWGRRLGFALDVARGMEHLRARGLVHRDLKSLNVFVDAGWRCKVGDLGLSRAVSDKMTARKGTLEWMAPELFDADREYGQPVDVFSFGIVMWEIWAQAYPYSKNRDYPGNFLVQKMKVRR